LVEPGKRLKELEQPAATERKRESGKRYGKGSGDSPEPIEATGDTREKVAAAPQS